MQHYLLSRSVLNFAGRNSISRDDHSKLLGKELQMTSSSVVCANNYTSNMSYVNEFYLALLCCDHEFSHCSALHEYPHPC